MIGDGRPLGKMIIELGMDAATFNKSLDGVKADLKVAQSAMKANVQVLEEAGDKYGALGQKINGLDNILVINQRKIEELRRRHQEAIKTFGAESEQVARLSKNVNTAVAQQASWGKQLQRTKAEIISYKTSTQELENELAKLQKKTDENVSSLKKSGLAFSMQKEKLKGLSEQSKKYQQIVDMQKQKIKNLTSEFGEHDRRVLDAKEKYQSLVEAQKELNTSFEQLNQKVGNVKPSFGQLADKIGQAENKLIGFSNRATSAGTKVTEAGQNISSGFGKITLAGGLGLGYTIKQAADFEQAMADVKALMSPDEWAKYGNSLTKMVKVLGIQTKYSNKEVAQGLQELIKAGVSLDSILGGGLKSSLNLATAGELELKDAAEIASTVLNSFKDDNISMAKAANLLAGAANASATDVNEMKFALSMVASVASGVGLSFKDTNNGLALLAQNGLKGSDAGTSLKTMLLNLSPTTKSASVEMMELGLASFNAQKGWDFLIRKGVKPASTSIGDMQDAFKKLAKEQLGAGASAKDIEDKMKSLEHLAGYTSSAFYDNNGKLRDMSTIAELLKTHLSGLTNEQKQLALKTMFGTDAIRASNILAKDGAKAFDEMGIAINKVSASDVAKTKMDTLKGSLEKMKGEAESAATAFGTSLIPAVKFTSGAIEKTVGLFNKLDESTQHNIAIMATLGIGVTALGTGLGFLMIGIGGLITGIGSITKGGANILRFLSNGTIQLGSFGSMTKASTLSLNAETTALNTNTSALERNNSARNGDIVSSGTSSSRSKKTSKTTTNVDVIPDNTTNSRVAKNASKVGKSAKALKYIKGAGAIGTLVGIGSLGYELFTGSGTKESIGGSVGGTIGGIGGGAAAGAAVGTFAGPIGVAIGTVAGGIIGGVAGDKIGSSVGKALDKRSKAEATLKNVDKGSSLNLNVKGISTSTQAALKEYDKLYSGTKIKLNQIMLSNTVINTKIKNDTIKKFSDMKDSVIDSIKERQQRERVEAQKALDSNKSLSTKEKQQALSDLNKKQQAEITKINQGNARIKQIMNNASSQKRSLSRSEKAEIQKINNQMYNAKIKSTAKGEKELTLINKQRSKQRYDITTKEMNDTISKARNEYKKTVDSANKKYKEKVKYAKTQRYQLGVITDEEYKAIVTDAKNERNKVIEHAENKKKSVIAKAKTQKKESTKASRDQKEENVRNARKETSLIGAAWDGLTGFFKGISSWFKKWFGNNNKTTSPPHYKEYQSYADGTYQGKHPGGTALVGEEGTELSYIPGSGYQLLGVGGPQLLDLPRGTSVLPHDQTMKILNQYNFPAYKDGTNDTGFFEKTLNLLTSPSKLWDKLIGKFNYVDKFPKFFNSWAGAKGVTGWAKGLAIKYIKNLFNDFGNINYSPSAGINQWKSLAARALRMTGQFSMDNLNRLLMQMSTESGGNPKSINLWDSNAKKGIPSKGLMQVIDPTFKAYAMPGFNKNIYDPLSNMIAAIRYSVSRYGSLTAAWRGVGYADGGIINKQHLAMLGEGNKKEVVIPLQPKPGMRSRALDLLAYATEKLLGSSTTQGTTNQGNNAMLQAILKQNEMMQQQINLLTAILAKDNNLYIDSREIKKGQDRLTNQTKKVNAMARGLLPT